MSDATRITFTELADRLGVAGSGATAGRHRAARSASGMGRIVAGAVAGAAFTGGVAMAAAPAASAQSADIDVNQIGQMAQEFAQGIGLNEQQLREYALDPALFGSLGIPAGAVGGAHAPTFGPITSGFGPRWGTFHNGTDFGAPIGTPLFAAKSGTVVAAGPASGYGLWIRIQTDDGYLLEYGHNDQNYVSVGQRVHAGQVIGTVGNRGYSTGPHLHFGVRNPAGQWIDPVPWLRAQGVAV
ncbi:MULTISPECIES: M23 family metallopeptidase [unclassified Dietzia]|uniref:M23 family metallopeptidase n=1 Tax=unclassified Dietzia TaxID=2617939 RepID=UPI0015F9F617|nr:MULTISPECIES: M23 family metallopeptidase [unclassified Dietzia]MBB1023656.1 M23 family metallopeptidase [Dietzia sp. DQ12-76]MBB1028458.1 M23 family metallopeptidase [Dietzia sp. DQ11-38-2]